MTPDDHIRFCVEQTQKIVQIATALERLLSLLARMEENLRVIADGAMTEAKDLRTEVKRLRRVLHKHGLSADTSGEEFDGDPDERGRDENGNALA